MKRFPRTSFGWKLRAFQGSFETANWGVRVGKLLSILVIIAFSVGATFFFRMVFLKLLDLEGIGEPLLWRVIGITLVTVFGLLVVSNLITGIATLYRSPEISFMFARPVSYRRIFLERFTDNLVYSTWSLAVLGVPILVAWGWVFGLPFWVVACLILFGLAPLVMISAEVGILALMGLVIFAQRTSSRAALALVMVVIVGVIALAVVSRNRGLIAEGTARISTVERYLTGLDRQSQALLTPPHWLVGSMRATSIGGGMKSAFLTGLITLTAVVWLRWLVLLSGRIYYRSWTAFGDLAGHGSRAPPQGSAARFTRGLLPNPFNAMLRKDLLQFTRNPNQWAQFLILAAFLLVYLLNLIYISSRFTFSDPFWRTLVLFLNFAFTGFILATLSVRFVFPLISLEGRGFWVVRSSPVTVNLLFWEKFFLAFAVFMGLCEVIVFVSNHVLQVKGAMMILTTAGTFLMGATLTGLAIGMGALLPDYKDESPMRIASTTGGVLTVIISLVYVGMMVAILAWPAQGYFIYLTGRGPFPQGRALQALALVAGLNLLVLLPPIRLGRRAIQTMEL